VGVRKSVSFDPLIYDALQKLRKKKIKERLESVSFSEVLNEVLREILIER